MDSFFTEKHYAFREEVRAFARRELEPLSAEAEESETYRWDYGRPSATAGISVSGFPENTVEWARAW